jgi:predicted Zn-dependent peptidase
MAARGVSEYELATAKRAVFEELELRYETNTALATSLGPLLSFGDPAVALPKLRAQIAAITLDEVNEAAARYLASDSRVVVVAGPHPRDAPELQRLRSPTFYTLEQP